MSLCIWDTGIPRHRVLLRHASTWTSHLNVIQTTGSRLDTTSDAHPMSENSVTASKLLLVIYSMYGFWQLFEIWKFSIIFIVYIVSFICINHIGLMVNEWNKLNLQNKIHKPDQLLIGGYRRGGLIFRIAVFMQITGPCRVSPCNLDRRVICFFTIIALL